VPTQATVEVQDAKGIKVFMAAATKLGAHGVPPRAHLASGPACAATPPRR
jgi:hypothetical protein